ncbi:MAG: hypothetical protein IPL79_09480 [Myxococcales bacterium]|nr:hypothetical protein [Myxococcales bacterium]
MASKATLPETENIQAGAFGKSLTRAGYIGGIVLLAISLLLGNAAGDNLKRFFFAYLIGWSFIWTIAIGALFFVIIHHLTRARWSVVVRRVAEAITITFPVLGVLGLAFIIPVVAGYDDLYYWAHHDAHLSHHIHGKLGWLDPTFFAARYVLYFALYSFIAYYFAKRSRLQDETGDEQLSETMRVASGPMVILFALTTIFAGFDILMSMQPAWYSTIYSVNIFGGGMIGSYATLTLLSMALQRAGRVQTSITTEHYHDLGKMLFAFTFFWAYTAFSQFMLQWYANIPEETIFYIYRWYNNWNVVSMLLLVGHWALPFLFLLSRWTKRVLPSLAFFAAWQLVFHWLDLYWNIMPNYTWPVANGVVTGPLTGDPAAYTVGFTAVDVTTWFALMALFVGAIGTALGKGKLVPVKDPRLGICLAHENF